MTLEILVLLVIIGTALVLLALERFPADVTALGVLIALIVAGLVPADRAFAGFGSDIVIMILGLLIMTAALLRTGVVDMAGRGILRRAGGDPRRLLVIVTISVATLSAFISNTAATAFFLPITIGVAARARMSPSKLLMPLAFASILTSAVTLVSTSTNIVVSGLMTRYRMPPMGMFELAPVGIPIAVAGVAYILLVAPRLIPERPPARDLPDAFGLRPYLTEVLVPPDSPLVGKTLADAGLGRDLDLTVVQVTRESGRGPLPPRATMRLTAGDVLLVEGSRDEILKVKDIAGIDIKADVELADPALQSEDIRLVEVLVMPRSRLIGRTLKGYRFRERFGLQVLAINRHGETIRRKISQVRLQLGDVLLVQGHHLAIAALEDQATLRILGPVTERRPNLQRAPLAIIIFAGALALATFKVLPLPVAVLAGALATFVTRCITPEEAYREVEWKALILIGCMLALGAAMEETGTARYLATSIVRLTEGVAPIWMLAGFFALTVMLTPMSHQAAAIVILPIAIQAATQLDLNPRAFAMMIAIAASCSFLTPFDPSVVMVYGPGRYRFMDFLKVGAPLTVLIYLIAMALVPRVWPL